MADRVLSEIGKTFKLAFPVIGTQFVHLSMVFVDNLMVARLGAPSLAAMAMATVLFNLFFLFSASLLSAIRPMVGQLYGSGQVQEIGCVGRLALMLAAAFCLPSIAVFLAAKWIFLVAGQDPSLVPIAHDYLMAVSWGMPAMVGFMSLRELIEAMEDAIPPFLTSLFGSAVNVVANMALIFGYFGFPALGVKGAAIATSLTQWSMLIILLAYIAGSPRYRAFKMLTGPWRLEKNVVKDILRVGLPLGGIRLVEYAFFFTVALLAGTLGVLPLAAHQIAYNAEAFVSVVPIGLAMATCARVAIARGRRDMMGVRRAAYAGLALTILIVGVPALGFVFYAESVGRLYTADRELLVASTALIVIAGYCLIVDSLQTVGVGVLQGLTDTKIPFFATVASFWLVGIPVGYALSVIYEWGARGLWVGMLAAFSVALVFYLWRFRRLTAVLGDD